MAAKVVVACGSAIATSHAVAKKLGKLLADKGVTADIVAVPVRDLPTELEDATAYVSVVKADAAVSVPVFSGVPFLTGIGQAAELDRLVALLRRR